MRPDPDPILCAYLDGELDASGRRRVERSTRSDPALASRLAALARTRDLVATLSTPGPSADVSGAVVSALATRAAARSQFRSNVRAVVEMAGPALAAAILLGAFWKSAPKAAPIAARPTVVARALPAPPRPVDRGRVGPFAPPARVAAPWVAIRESALAGETRRMEEREALAAKLGRAELHRIDVTVDRFEPATLATVETAIRGSNFRDGRLIRLTVLPANPDDPEGGPRCVYVIDMDRFEHSAFRRNLDEAFPERVAEPSGVASRDEILALGEIGRIEVVPNERRGTLMPPPVDADRKVAVRRAPRSGHREELVEADRDRPGPDRRPPATPPARPARGKEAATPATEGAGDPPLGTYVVCVVARRRGPS